MNNRIKELADYCRNSTGHEGNNSQAEHFDAEKFSYLLLNEVIDQLEACFAGSTASLEKEELWKESVATFAAWNGAIKLSRDKIKERFGVEE